MMIFSRREHALDVPVQCLHDADARPILIANARAQPLQAAPVLNQIAHQPSRLAEWSGFPAFNARGHRTNPSRAPFEEGTVCGKFPFVV
jgi:hypothetical protein